MTTTWITVLVTIIAGMLFGCTSRNTRAFVIGMTAGMVSYIAFGGVASTEDSTAHWLIIHAAIFLPVLFAVYGIRRLIQSLDPPNESAEYGGEPK